MEKKAEVFMNGILAGLLIKTDEGYTYIYDDKYKEDPCMPAISLTLPKNQKEYYSKTLFSFFFGLLSEGDLKTIQSRSLGIDENDHFTRLIKTGYNTIGAISVQEVV